MLTLYRRHSLSCPHSSRKEPRRYKSCKCPIWVQGSLGGEYVKRSLDLTSWEAASDLITSWTASGEVGVARATVPSLSEAIDAYIKDCDARNLAETTMKKRQSLLQSQLLTWCQARSLTRLRQLDSAAMREFRGTWADGPLSSLKKLERLRSFFRFCVLNNWLQANPVAGIRAPEVQPSPTLPFSDEEFAKILAACDRYEGDQDRMRAFVLVMRYSGLRISDTCQLRRDAVVDGRIFTRQEKTGQPVYVPVPPVVIDALSKVKGDGEMYFWSGNGKLLTTVGNWRKYLGWLFKKSGVAGGRSHRFRDTFSVSLLEKGVSIETVSVLLGHSDIRITLRHYRPWVKSLQQKLEAAVKQTW